MGSHLSIQLAVIGGGAAGFMGAITAAERGVRSVLIFEATQKTLEKVRISGGGRCNITNACWDPTELAPNYPRGEIALRGSFSRFATGDAVSWFENKGLNLIEEEDGRIFPKSNSSQEVIDVLSKSAQKAGVKCFTQMAVTKIDYVKQKGFILRFRDKRLITAQTVLIATGGNPSGHKLAVSLGHSLIKPNPSLFSLKLKSPWLESCAGISVKNASLKLLLDKKEFKQKGTILVTHKGLSGPSILRLTSFAARNLYSQNYKGDLYINWVNENNESIRNYLKDFRQTFANNTIKNNYPFKMIPKRLWVIFLNRVSIDPSNRWSSLSTNDEIKLSEILGNNHNIVNGKGPFGEEFVTAGGIKLNQVNFKSMESRICRGLYFAGEVLDIDGITGGFNFQHCWTSAWIAGHAIASEARNKN